MKIAFVMHNLIRGNGQGRMQYEIVRHVLEQGHEALLFADRVAPEVLQWGARWIRVAQTPAWPGVLGVYRFANAADRALERFTGEIDLVVAAGFTMRRPHDLNICNFVHGAWWRSPVHISRVQRGPRAWYQALYTRCNARWEKQAFAAAGVVIGMSQKIVEELVSIGVPRTKIELIYNGVDLEEFKPGPVSRSALGLPEDIPLALFVGDIRTARKNLDTVLKALVNVPKVHLVVLGATERSPFPHMARELGVAERTHFMGFRSNVNEYMRACDLFVFPSRYEAGSLVIIEALASGLPIVTAVTAGGCEIMSADCGVILQDPDDVAGLAEAMAGLAGDPTRRRHAAIAARAVAEQHGWQAMGAGYLAVFKGLCPQVSA